MHAAMKFAEADKRQDTPRPLSHCGSMVAPGRDARWRDVTPHPWVEAGWFVVGTGATFTVEGRGQIIDTARAREQQYAAR